MSTPSGAPRSGSLSSSSSSSERSPSYWTVKRTARELDMSESTIRDMIDKGKLKAARIDTGKPRKAIRIPKSEIERITGAQIAGTGSTSDDDIEYFNEPID